MIVSDPNDPFTQEDVINYMSDIKTLLESAGREGKLDVVERELCKNDLYYLGYFIFGIEKLFAEEVNGETIYHPWLFNRCREVQANPDFNIDIWAREHFKSTIITYLLTVQDILNNPEIAVGIISYNATIAQNFVRQIRTGLETPRLKELFPDIIPNNTKKGKYDYKDEFGKADSKGFKWSDEKFEVIRKTKRKEPTCSGYGLVSGQPVGMHFDVIVYDDCVTPDSVRTREQNDKTTEAWKMSLNTGSGESVKFRVIGTRYDYYDTYFAIMNPFYKEKGVMGGSRFNLRIKPARLQDGTTVLYSKEYINNKEATMVGFVFASQIMCNPQQSASFRFQDEWLVREPIEEIFKNRGKCNWYIFVDPANTQSKKSDYTAMVVVGTRADGKYILADAVYDKLNPSQRYEKLFEKVQKWSYGNKLPNVWYEQSGLSTDMYNITKLQKEMGFYFPIHAATTRPKLVLDDRMSPSGMKMKTARIMSLEPLFRNFRIVIADKCPYVTADGRQIDVIAKFLEDEYSRWPFSDHDDFLDALCRIADAEAGASMIFPSNREIHQIRAIQAPTDPYTIPKGSYIPY